MGWSWGVVVLQVGGGATGGRRRFGLWGGGTVEEKVCEKHVFIRVAAYLAA